MSGTVTVPFSAYTQQYFSPQVTAPQQINQWQQALAMARQRATLQQAMMQQIQQQQAAQQKALLQSGAIPGPAASPIPDQTPMAGGPIPVAGGGQDVITMQGVTGAVPMSKEGIPDPQLQRFKGAPGGQNGPGGANPFSIRPGGDQAQMEQAIRSYSQQANEPYGYNPYGKVAGSDQTFQSVIDQLSKFSTPAS